MQPKLFRLFSILMILGLLLALPGQATPARAASILRAAPSASGSGDCSSWANACTLQTALTNAASGDEIWVKAGTHKPTTGSDRTATFQLKAFMQVYGGFNGTETIRDQRNYRNNQTVLSGDLSGNDNGTITTDEPTRADNSYHVVTGAQGANLDGFVITAGNANNLSTSPHAYGGGLYNTGDLMMVNHIVFTGNSAYNGGGLYNNSALDLGNVTFRGNSATYNGGGAYNFSSGSLNLSNITFSGNRSIGDSGGGMHNVNGSLNLSNVTFSGNYALITGGGLFTNSTKPTNLMNVTFSGNSAANGGGIYNSYSNPTITNTILWGNTGSQIDNNNSAPVVSYSVIQDGYPGGTNIITSDPKLGALGEYGGFTPTIPLLTGSSAIESGKDGMGSCSDFDQRGVARPQGYHCDIGAYEAVVYTIFGNAGVPGATLSYTAGIPQTATADGNGSYYFLVVSGWGGTVTPSKPGYTFIPANRTYTNVTANQADQNYTATPTATAEGVATYRLVTGGAYWLNYNYSTGSFTNYLSLGDGGTTATCYPAPMDFDGDGIDEPTHLCGGGWHFFETNGAFVKSIFAYMQPGDIPVPGDYNGDGKDEVAVYRRVTGGAYWLFYDFATGSFTNYVSIGDGGSSAACYPAAMDFDKDGADELTHLCGGGWHFFETNGAFVKSIFAYMQTGDMPIPGDYNGDGKDEVATYRRAPGGGYWLFYDFASASFTNYLSLGDGGTSAACYPKAMDFDGDGNDELTHLCGGGWHFFETNGSFVKSIFAYMQVGDQPVPGEYGN